MRDPIVIENAEGNYSAYIPDLPGCVATGATIGQAESQIRDAIKSRLEGVCKEGISLPQPANRVQYVDVAA